MTNTNKGADKHCIWTRAFDGHFNISCSTGERANGNFKPDDNYRAVSWNFKYCPYCGREIEVYCAEPNDSVEDS